MSASCITDASSFAARRLYVVCVPACLPAVQLSKFNYSTHKYLIGLYPAVIMYVLRKSCPLESVAMSVLVQALVVQAHVYITIYMFKGG
jgi:hypothetical protein